MFQRSFSAVDAVVVLLLAGVISQLMVACSEAISSPAHRRANAVQIENIHQSMIEYAQMNNGIYPGLSSASGRRVQEVPATDKSMYGAPQPSNKSVAAVYSILLTGGLVEPEALISPLDFERKTPAPSLPALFTLSSTNYSYAMLQFGDDQGNDGRRKEWRDTGNAKAPIVGDRGRKIDLSLQTTGLHDLDRSGDSTKWTGNIGWNDGHVSFETTGLFEPNQVKIGGLSNEKPDDLFDASDGSTPDANAKFSYH